MIGTTTINTINTDTDVYPDLLKKLIGGLDKINDVVGTLDQLALMLDEVISGKIILHHKNYTYKEG